MMTLKLSMPIIGFLVSCLTICAATTGTKSSAQAITEELRHFDALPPVLTHAPSDTLQSLKSLHDALSSAFLAYQTDKTFPNYNRIILIADALISLIDLSDENLAAQRDTSIRTALALVDIVEQVDVAEFAALPDREAAILDRTDYYPVPGTPLMVQRIQDGQHEGEFLFSANSTKIAPRFLREIAMQSPQRLDALWSTRFLQISGPMIPASFDSVLPEFMLSVFWGTPIWKIVFSMIATLVVVFACVGLNSTLVQRVTSGFMLRSTSRLILSSCTLGAFVLLNKFFDYQLFLTGSFARFETFVASIAIYGSLAWSFWCLMAWVSDKIADRKSSSDKYYDESMMRLLNHVIALIGAIWILAYGAQTLGFPLLSIIAGLGVGGLAVALAIRPTLENLISGFVLYLERAVKVGDYCSFSEWAGTVESIGIRSTHIRSLDRTLISVPNSKFVDMELVNWARCDEMQINAIVGLRYETDTDQLRFVLAKIRSMMHAHPRINSDTARVRFVGYGNSSLDVDIRVYAQTREWNDFYAIREDVLFRVKEIVEASGTGFAFPSQTVYVSRDDGLDSEKTKHSVSEVGRWRNNRELPFPNFSSEKRERMEGKLRYPPLGSPEFNGADEELGSVDEPLSVEADEPASNSTKNEGASGEMLDEDLEKKS